MINNYDKKNKVKALNARIDKDLDDRFDIVLDRLNKLHEKNNFDEVSRSGFIVQAVRKEIKRYEDDFNTWCMVKELLEDNNRSL